MKKYQLTLVAVAALAIAGAGCANKKVAVTTAPPPTPPVEPATTPEATPAPQQAAPPEQAAFSPAPRMPSAATRARIDELLAKIDDAYFDYNRHTLRPDAIETLRGDSSELRDLLTDYPDYKLTIEGHCDERGSDEYNLALGDQRARAAKDYLTQVGIPSDQLSLVSYGKEQPICQEHTEACWQKNRRIHIVAQNPH